MEPYDHFSDRNCFVSVRVGIKKEDLSESMRARWTKQMCKWIIQRYSLFNLLFFENNRRIICKHGTHWKALQITAKFMRGTVAWEQVLQKLRTERGGLRVSYLLVVPSVLGSRWNASFPDHDKIPAPLSFISRRSWVQSAEFKIKWRERLTH